MSKENTKNCHCNQEGHWRWTSGGDIKAVSGRSCGPTSAALSREAGDYFYLYGTYRHGLVVGLTGIGLWLNSMILGVLSDLNDSMILWPPLLFIVKLCAIRLCRSLTFVLICLGVSVRKMEEFGSLALILVCAPCRAGKKTEWSKAGLGCPILGATSRVILK